MVKKAKKKQAAKRAGGISKSKAQRKKKPKKKSRQSAQNNNAAASPIDFARAENPAGIADQLPWWYELMSSMLHNSMLDRQRAIFTNRTLRMDKIEAIGFDFDHTLAVYNCEELDRLATQLVVDRLIKFENYRTRDFKEMPQSSFARKGVIVDIELGNILKTDRYGHVVHAYHGTTALKSEQKKEAYGNLDVIPHVTHGLRFIQADTAFANPELLIFSALAPKQAKEGKCRELWKVIRKHTDMIHRDGSLKEVIKSDPLRFVEPDPETLQMLKHLRNGGKKLFLLTNSEWDYTHRMANPALGLGEAEGPEWMEFFDVVIAEGRKPGFFKPSKSTKRKVPGAPNAFCGGHISHLEKSLGCSGTEILYVGDHIYGDLITSKRNQNWRTMLVVSELEEEMLAQSGMPGVSQELHHIDQRRTETERAVQHWSALERKLRDQDSKNKDLLRQLQQNCRAQRVKSTKALKRYIRQRELLRNRMSQATNKYWGSLFRASSELTYYGRQLEDFACTYTSRATNLLLYPSDQYHRSAMDYLPHETESM